MEHIAFLKLSENSSGQFAFVSDHLLIQHVGFSLLQTALGARLHFHAMR